MIPRRVSEDLELDVAGGLEEPLEVDRAVAEGGLRDAAALRERRRQVFEPRPRATCPSRRRPPTP